MTLQRLTVTARNLAMLLCLIAWADVSSEAYAGERVSLRTRDGVQLAATYYPSILPKGTPEAKQVTPVVLLHDFKDTRATFTSLAERLQAFGVPEEAPFFAAITVDLRGHGGSTRQTLPNGQQQELTPARLGKEDLFAMASLDMEAVRSFLVDKNDEGSLNINKLCVVGAGMGASVAVNWAYQDWSAPPLAIGKQGQDVKALALISPQWSYQGLTMRDPMRLRPFKQNVAWLMIYGSEDSQAESDVRRIRRQLERFHQETSDDARNDSSSLASLELESNLQGGNLLTQFGRPIEDRIVAFLVEHVASRELPWINRRGRLP